MCERTGTQLHRRYTAFPVVTQNATQASTRLARARHAFLYTLVRVKLTTLLGDTFLDSMQTGTIASDVLKCLFPFLPTRAPYPVKLFSYIRVQQVSLYLFFSIQENPSKDSSDLNHAIRLRPCRSEVRWLKHMDYAHISDSIQLTSHLSQPHLPHLRQSSPRDPREKHLRPYPNNLRQDVHRRCQGCVPNRD